MRKIFTLSSVLLSVSLLCAQSTDYKVVFDLTSKDTVVHKSVIRWIDAILKSNAEAQLEVVLYGQALDMVVKDKSVMADAVTKVIATKKATFKVCAISMKRHNIEKSQLLPGVEIVDDGIYEIVVRQKQGWGYIKASQ